MSARPVTPPSRSTGWDWDVVRAELQGRSRRSATIGESNYGNANGAKWDLTLNYLPQAEATGRVTVHHWHVVDRIGQDRRGRYTVDLRVVDPTGEVLESRTVTCDRLVLGAGSIGTSELFVRARAEGTLKHLDDSVGEGFGTNGDAAMVQFISLSKGLSQGSPSATTVLDASLDMPARMESWYTLGVQVNAGIIGSLGIGHGPAAREVRPQCRQGRRHRRLARGRQQGHRRGPARDAEQGRRGRGSRGGRARPRRAGRRDELHRAPAGGAVIGRSTDAYGRVKGHPGLYVMDGAGIPGSTGTANPSLTITALAERNIAKIIADGR